MKIPKQPKRFRSAASKTERNVTQSKKEERAKQIPDRGDIILYLDDERPCPPGWTLVRTPGEFFKIITDPVLSDRITWMSLDWYLGVGYMNGTQLCHRLEEHLVDNPNLLRNIEKVGLHSSDRDMALSMYRILEPLFRTLGRDVMFDIRTPT